MSEPVPEAAEADVVEQRQPMDPEPGADVGPEQSPITAEQRAGSATADVATHRLDAADQGIESSIDTADAAAEDPE